MFLRPRHLRRYREIAEILADHGFGAILGQLGLGEHLNLPRRIIRRRPFDEETISMPRRFRLVIEDLGPTFIKIGQVLSTRSDLLPPAFLDELSKLQDDVDPLSWELLQPVVEKELDAPIESLFGSVDPIPIASASIAQVHAATLKSGEDIVLKIQRPKVDSQINTDLDILNHLTQLAQERTAIGKRYEVVDIAEEYSIALREELDFRREGRNADRFRENFADESSLYVPKIYWDLSTRKLLVMERIDGIKINNIAALDAVGYDRHQLALVAADFILKEVLEVGFFHADPHPGNLLILPGGVIGVLDFGTVGRLDRRDRLDLARLFIVIVQLDADGVVDQLMRMGIADPKIDRIALQRSLRRLLMKYHGLPIYDIPAAEVLEGLEPIIYEHHLRIPSDYWLLIKTIVVMQGVGLALDPEFDIFKASQPYLGKLFRQFWNPSRFGQNLIRMGADWGDFIVTFPQQSSRILDQLERGDFEVRIDVPELERTTNRMDVIVNRLIYSVLISAIMVALALLIPQLNFAWPWKLITWIIVIGFVTLIFLGLSLLWSIFRSGRGKSSRR
jgi:ubiquinone biosynthesis protein